MLLFAQQNDVSLTTETSFLLNMRVCSNHFAALAKKLPTSERQGFDVLLPNIFSIRVF